MKWLDNIDIEYTILLNDILFFSDSLVNVISISKLGIDAKDTLINI